MARYAKFFSVGGGAGPNGLQLPLGTVLDATLRQVQDGLGTGSPLYISTLRLGITSDSSVTTQTSSVIQATTTNANLVIAPNGTGALIADIPDGTLTGGNSRSTNAVDLQMSRTAADQVARGNYSSIIGGGENTTVGIYSIAGGRGNFVTGTYAVGLGYQNNSTNSASVALGWQNAASGQFSNVSGGTSNTASSNYATVSGGQSNTASTDSHATIVGGISNVSSGPYSTAGGSSNSISGRGAIGIGETNVVSGRASSAFGSTLNITGSYSGSFGNNNLVSSVYSMGLGNGTKSYLLGQLTNSGNFNLNRGNNQYSFINAGGILSLTTGGTAVLSLDGTGVTNLIIPDGSTRAWNVQVNWVGLVSAISGTATGISIGDVITSVDLLAFKKVAGVSSASSHTSTATKTMVTTPASYAACSINYTAGASQEMALTFTGPIFAGGGTITMRVNAKIELTEIASN